MTRTGFREYRFPVFSEWNSIRPNLSRTFTSWLVDLKSRLSSLDRA